MKGAFTGALSPREGRFKVAHGGTIFLDEVGDLPLDTQVKLLRVLQEREFEPIGSNKTIRVDVRIIAATNRDLAERVRTGAFRSDLFYRLNVIPIRVPALRERPTDIRRLTLFFAERFAQRFGKRIDGIAADTLERLSRYPWPGNVRELQNVIERAVILSSGPTLTLEQELEPPAAALAAPGGHSDHLSLADLERRHIRSVLTRTAGVIEGPNGAAKILNLHPNTLRSRMQRLGIERPWRGSP